jgi:hypothetical protein
LKGLRPGLPDGMFSNQKIPIWVNFGGNCNVDVGIFHGFLAYFTGIWLILRTFGIFHGHLVYFMDIWYISWTFGISHGHLVYFMDIWYISLTFGIFCGNLVYFSHVGIWQLR